MNYYISNVLRRLNLMVVFLFFCIVITHAQNKSVSGTVTNVNGESIPGVTVVVKGSFIGTTTDVDGNYIIESSLEETSVLVFSFIGMKTKEITVGSQTVINVRLSNDILGLDEVVIVGYGSQAKRDVTGSVSVVGTDEMEDRPNTQVGSLIQGKAAGVKVISSSGKPSQGFSVRIRGTNSINASSEPLYVVDGVPTTDTRSINPYDIESISILKDASSAAIYGAQGANGVVIITTKRGTTSKPKVNFNMYTGYSSVWKKIDVLNGAQYKDLMQEMGQETDWDLYNKNTNWQDEIFQKGQSQNYQISLSGTSNKTNYYFSAGWVEQEGAIRSASMDRANFKINLDQDVNDWLTIGSRIAYTKYRDVDVNDNESVNTGGVLLGVLTTPSIIGIYNEDGTFTSNPFQNWENPLASTDGSEREYNSQRILGNVYGEINLLKGVKFKTNLGIDNNHGVYDYFLNPYLTSYGRALNGMGQNNTYKSSYYIFDNTLSYDGSFGAHSIKALVGTVAQKYLWENSNIERRNFSSDGITTVNGGSEIISANATKSEKANASFIGRINYSYLERYLLTANFRADGSSVFGPENRWGYFPSFSAGWRISNESFMETIDIIDDLKLRAGWGIVGNDQIAPYAYLGRIVAGANYPIGGVTMPGTYPASIENDKLKWEESKQTNIGIDVTVLKRISITADAYIKRTGDLLLNAPLPHSTGFDNAVQNIGELENKGVDFQISSVNLNNELKWSTDFNISFNKNKVTNLVGQEMVAGGIAGRGDAILIKEGYSLGTFYGYEFGGVDPETGQAYYINKDGESTINPDPDEDRKVIGNANPDFIYGLTNTFTYKGISLTIFLEGLQGNDMLNASRFETEGMTGPKNQITAVLDRWRQPGDITDIPASSWGDINNSRISTRFIEDGSYLRVKTLTLSYQLPKNLLSQIKLEGVRIYVTGENLLTYTNYSGFDPEVNAFGDSNTAFGIDYGTYPQTRNIIFGLNVTF